jgi:hypothetical protein
MLHSGNVSHLASGVQFSKAGCIAGNRLDFGAYRCADVAARNRQNGRVRLPHYGRLSPGDADDNARRSPPVPGSPVKACVVSNPSTRHRAAAPAPRPTRAQSARGMGSDAATQHPPSHVAGNSIPRSRSSSSFCGELTRLDIGHIVIGPAGKGASSSCGSGSCPNQHS